MLLPGGRFSDKAGFSFDRGELVGASMVEDGYVVMKRFGGGFAGLDSSDELSGMSL